MGIGSLTSDEAKAINNMNQVAQNTLMGSQIQYLLAGTNLLGNVWYVDGTKGYDTNPGTAKDAAFKTIQKAVDMASAFDSIFVKPQLMATGATDPVSYAENIIIPATKPNLAIIGLGTGKTQGGIPQIRKGSGTAAQITIRAPGCVIANLGINGAGATGGGILLDDNGSTKTAFGTSIINCHFKNCKGTTATNAATGGAIQWSSAGNAWQVLIKGNRFYKNVGDVVLLGTSGSVPQDVVIEDNIFSGNAADVDCNLYLSAGSGMIGLVIRRNEFPCWPAVGAGTNVMPVRLTGCTGSMSDNMFGTTGKTFGAAANALVPTTVLMSGNYQESGLIART